MSKRVWAFIKPDGSILADSDFKDEREAWVVGLGWPTRGEVKEAKKKGYRVVEVTIEIPDDK